MQVAPPLTQRRPIQEDFRNFHRIQRNCLQNRQRVEALGFSLSLLKMNIKEPNVATHPPRKSYIYISLKQLCTPSIPPPPKHTRNVKSAPSLSISTSAHLSTFYYFHAHTRDQAQTSYSHQ